MSLRVLTLSTLFPDITRPNFGVFVERQTRELASRPGVDVTVIAPVGIAAWPLSRLGHYAPLASLPFEEKWRDLTVFRPRFPVIPKIGGRLHVPLMTKAILPLAQALHREHPFDVIDASFFYPDGPVAARLAKALGIPFSIKARGADIHHWGTAPGTRRLVREAGRAADGLLAVSGAMKRSMVALGMEEGKIRVHYTGVDLERFQPADKTAARQELKLDHVEGPLILCVGALIERKGQALLIEALRELPNAYLLLAGHGPERTAYQKLAESIGVSLRVGFLGAVPHDRLPVLYNAADVMAMPSSSEGLANAWVESLACGTPIVISDVGGARELLSSSDAGRIIERTPQAITGAVQSIMTQPVDRDAVRQAALPFTWATNGDALTAHLEDLVRAASTPR